MDGTVGVLLWIVQWECFCRHLKIAGGIGVAQPACCDV